MPKKGAEGVIRCFSSMYVLDRYMMTSSLCDWFSQGDSFGQGGQNTDVYLLPLEQEFLKCMYSLH